MNKYPTVTELSDKYPFFKPMMLAIGREIRHSATSFKLLVSAGASLASIMDVALDVSTIYYYNSLGLTETANLMTVFVCMSMVLQITLVIFIHHRHRKRMMLELLATLTFMKQGINFWRTYTADKMKGHEMVNPVFGETFYKINKFHTHHQHHHHF